MLITMILNVATIIVLLPLFLLPALSMSLEPALKSGNVHEQGSYSDEEGYLFEGDIKLLDLHDNMRRRAIMQGLPINAKQPPHNPSMLSGTLWPNGTVYFKFYDKINFEISQTFLAAIGIWEKYTCLKFEQADENTTEYLLLTDTEGCSSYIGRVGIVQEVSISSLCRGVGHALHELGHAVGLWHEHTCLDRKKYIKIIWENVKYFAKTNFKTYKHSNTADFKYDFESIMHYPETAFAIDRGKPTIKIIYKPFSSCIKEVGQRHRLRFKDKVRLNLRFGCKDVFDDDPCPLHTKVVSPTTDLSLTTDLSSTTFFFHPLPPTVPTKSIKEAFNTEKETKKTEFDLWTLDFYSVDITSNQDYMYTSLISIASTVHVASTPTTSTTTTSNGTQAAVIDSSMIMILCFLVSNIMDEISQ